MASVEPYTWREGRVCKAEGWTGKPPHGDDCRCKVLLWRCRWRTPEGKSRSKNFDRKRDADAQKHKVESTKHEGSYIDPGRGRQLFMDHLDEWALSRDWKDSQRDQWPAKRKRIDKLMDRLRLGQLDRLTLDGARNKHAQTYARSTVEGDMFTILAAARSAFEVGKISKDPTIGVEAAPKRRAGESAGVVTPDMVPTRAEALALLNAAPERFRAAVALGLAGQRVGEVMAMSVERLELAKRKVTVWQQVSVQKGKGAVMTTPKNEKERTIVVPPLVAVELRRHLRNHETGPATGRDGKPVEVLFPGVSNGLHVHGRFYEQAWYPTLEKVGMPRRFDFHALRHFCVSNLLAEGAPLPAVAGYVGDTVQTVSRTYAHWLRDDEDVPADILAKVLAPASDDTTMTQPAKIASDRQ